MDRALSRAMNEKSRSCSTSLKALVGSSRINTLASREIAWAISIICRAPTLSVEQRVLADTSRLSSARSFSVAS